MSRLIDADALQDRRFLINEEQGAYLPQFNKGYQAGWNAAIEEIMTQAPTVDGGCVPVELCIHERYGVRRSIRYLDKARMMIYTEGISCELAAALGYEVRELPDNAQGAEK